VALFCEAGWYRGPIVAMLHSTFITKVPTTNQSHEVGYDQTNRVVYALGGGLVAFAISLCALHRFQSTYRRAASSNTLVVINRFRHAIIQPHTVPSIRRDRRGDGDY
jgi:hypothetical protein